MSDPRTPRPVSGEIVADGIVRPAEPVRATEDVLDAEFETVGQPAPAAPKAAAAPPINAIGSTAAPTAGLDMLAAVEAGPAQRFARGGPLFWVFGIALALAAFWVSGGHALVRSSPFFEAEEPAAALRVSAVTSRVDASGVHPLLFVDGEAVNDGSLAEPLPPIEIAVTANDGTVTRYRLGTSDRPLPPGERFAFSSRLQVPKNGVKTVAVTFAE